MAKLDLIISADSHMLEPGDLWVQRLPAKFKDQAPRVYTDQATNKSLFGCPGIEPIPAAALFGANVKPEDQAKHQEGATYEQGHRGGYDPAARLEDMAIDGIAADVLYTSLAFNLFWLEDPAFQEACFAVYNDWLAEFCSYAPDRFVGLALVSCFNIENAVKELTRAKKMGLKGAMIWCSPPDDRSFQGTFHDPFWAAAQEMDMSISLHILTGQGKESRGLAVSDQSDPMIRLSISSGEIVRSLAELIFSGTFERFPNLKIVSAENGIGWIPFFMQRADIGWNRNRFRYNSPLTMLPSERFRQNIWATFIDDQVGVRNADFIGVDNVMWSSDYPHTASTWPHSLEAIERQFVGMSDEDKVKICRDNAAKLYGFDLASLTALPGSRVAAD